MRSVEFAIIGGGVAGLTAANRLMDAGASAIVIEAKKYPLRTLCGEFISPEAIPQLKEWRIEMACHLDTACFTIGGVQRIFSLLPNGGAQTRDSIEQSLADRFRKRGGILLEGVRVEEDRNGHLILGNGQAIQYTHLIESVGQARKTDTLLHGKKGFALASKPLESLEMQLFPGGYIGATPIGNGRINLAMIATTECPPPNEFLHRLGIEHIDWQTGQLPAFIARQSPNLFGGVQIGDALGGVPPITGSGLGIAVTTGCMAAECLLENNKSMYHKLLRRRIWPRFYLAHVLHSIVMQKWGRHLTKWVLRSPAIGNLLWRMTR